jgi:hypothetical protein
VATVSNIIKYPLNINSGDSITWTLSSGGGGSGSTVQYNYSNGTVTNTIPSNILGWGTNTWNADTTSYVDTGTYYMKIDPEITAMLKNILAELADLKEEVRELKEMNSFYDWV